MADTIKVEVDAEKVCRICLQGSEDLMKSIYERDTTDRNLCLYEKIEKCGGIKIINLPELPSRICNKCNAFLTIAHKFRTICKNSDSYLREFVCKSSQQQTEEVDNDMEEYLFEYKPDDVIKSNEEHLLPQSDNVLDDHNAEVEFEEVAEYAELWCSDSAIDQDENLIEEESGDVEDVEGEDFSQNSSSAAASVSAPSPGKTLGITSDGTAIIEMVKEEPDSHSNKGKQVHICEICGNTYPRKFALEAHMRRHRNERPFECELCPASFHLNFQLTRHIRKHTGDRPYACQYCKRAFSDRSTMVKHERIHRNERPYSCEQCGKTFTYSSVLKVHLQTHTGEKPFHCDICGKRFARGHHLRAHLETLLHQNDPRTPTLLKMIKPDSEYKE